MIINNDECQWTWMNEGLNSFLQYRTEVERYENFPHWWGSWKSIAPFMKGDKSIQRPVMTTFDNVVAFRAEQYAKSCYEPEHSPGECYKAGIVRPCI